MYQPYTIFLIITSLLYHIKFSIPGSFIGCAGHCAEFPSCVWFSVPWFMAVPYSNYYYHVAVFQGAVVSCWGWGAMHLLGALCGSPGGGGVFLPALLIYNQSYILSYNLHTESDVRSVSVLWPMSCTMKIGLDGGISCYHPFWSAENFTFNRLSSCLFRWLLQPTETVDTQYPPLFGQMTINIYLLFTAMLEQTDSASFSLAQSQHQSIPIIVSALMTSYIEGGHIHALISLGPQQLKSGLCWGRWFSPGTPVSSTNSISHFSQTVSCIWRHNQLTTWSIVHILYHIWVVNVIHYCFYSFLATVGTDMSHVIKCCICMYIFQFLPYYASHTKSS